MVVAGANASVIASPSNGDCPTSPSLRGSGTWLDCGFYTEDAAGADMDHQTVDYLGGLGYGAGHSAGLMPAAASTSPTLTVSAPARASEATSVPVDVSLTNASGAPLSPAPVHVSLQAEWPIASTLSGPPVPTVVAGEQWLTMGEVTVTTDANGNAHALLPIALTDATGYPPSQLVFDKYRVVATYDGIAGTTPRHVASPITVTDGPGPVIPEAPLVPLLVLLASVPVALAGRRRTGGYRANR